MNKHKICNELIITSYCAKLAQDCGKFIEIVASYKKNPAFIIDIEDGPICPMLYIGKALLYLSHHSYKLHDNVLKYYNIASNQAKYIESLESWEINWLNILKYMTEEDDNKILELILKNAKENPNDLLNIRFGVFWSVVTADKQFMTDILEYHSKYEPNEENPSYLASKSFILEELRRYEESEQTIIKGLKIDPNNIQLQHVYSHVMYYQNRISDCIIFLEERKHLWEDNSNSFLNKHIRWHLSLSYLEMNDIDNSTAIIDDILLRGFDDAECPLSILGFMLRTYIRTGNFYEKYAVPVLEYLKNTEIYTKHYLFDILAFWLMSYCSCGLEDAQKALENILKISKRNFILNYKVEYLNLIKAMIHFGRKEYRDCASLLKKEYDVFRKFCGSDEQKQIIYELRLYCYSMLNEKTEFDKLISDEEIFDSNFKNFSFVSYLNKYFK
jgi:hypothetical protein